MMRVSILGAVIVAFLALAVYRAEPRAQTPQVAGGKGPVVVELFTSEGCSSCPPADALLRRLEASASLHGTEIIPLGWHVEYWDRLGWKDRFSSADSTRRQQQYAEVFGTDQVYTPQMVVDGRAEFVGSNREKAESEIKEASRLGKAAVSLAVKHVGQEQVELQTDVRGLPPASAARVWLLLTEANLQSEVRAGENQGSVMKHAAVVRLVKALGAAQPEKDFHQSARVALDKQWKSQDLRAVILVQEERSRAILGAASIPLR